MPFTAPPNIATDANYDAGPEVWNGQPTKRAPLAGQIAKGIIPGAKLTAQLFNYLMNAFSAAIVELQTEVASGAASSTDNAIARFDGTDGKVLQNSGAVVTDASEIEYVTPKTRTFVIPAGMFRPGSANWVWVKNRWEIPANAASGEKMMAYIDVPKNQHLSKVELAVRSEESGSGITMGLFQAGFATSLTAAALSEGSSDGTSVGTDTASSSGTTDQIIEFDPFVTGPLPYPLTNDSSRYAVRITKGASAGAGSTYVIVGDMRVTLSDTGPRSA